MVSFRLPFQAISLFLRVLEFLCKILSTFRPLIA